MIRKLSLIFVVGWGLVACNDQRVYEQFQELPQGWDVADTISFLVALPSIEEGFQLTTQFRCDISYPYNNLYYYLIIGDGQGQILRSDLEEVLFFEPKSGKPIGSGLGDLFTVEQTIANKLVPGNEDTLVVSMIQYMRQDVLQGIDRVGLRIDHLASD